MEPAKTEHKTSQNHQLRLEFAHPGDYDWEALAANTGRSLQV